MAKELHDHIHLFKVSETPTGATAAQWHITFPGINPKTTAAVYVKRGLTGVAHLHALRNDSNEVVQFKDLSLRFVVTPLEHEALLTLNGVKCYYVPHEHDDSGADIKHDSQATPQVQGYPVIAVVTDDTPLDASLQYYLVTMQLTDNSYS
jgi:hypothetical protein